MLVILFVVMGLPRPNSGPDDDRIDIRAHGVLNVGRHVQETSNGMALRSCFIEFVAKTHLQFAQNHCNPSVLGVPMMFPISRGNEKCVRERLANRVLVTFQDGPLRTVVIDILPNDGLCIPGLRRLCEGRRTDKKYRY